MALILALVAQKISGVNQFFRANYGNFNLDVRSTSKGRSVERWEGDLQKCDYPIQGRVQIVK